MPAFAADNTVAEVVVTAQKKSENINDVPESVTAVSGEKLDVIRSSGGDIRVLSARAPSLTLESSFGRTFPRPYIRGLGNTDFDLNASQPVSFVYDEVVLESPILKGLPLFDIDQVEVLRGPQGALFGRNTPAGVLKFESAKPTKTFGGYGQISAATYNTINAEGAVSGPIIGEVLSGRLSVLYQHRGDWIDNAFTKKSDATGGYDETAFRGQLLYTPSEDFSALLNVHHMDLDGTPQIFRANIIAAGSNNFASGFRRDTIAQDAQSRASQKVHLTGANLKVTYDLGGPVLTSVTGYETAEVYSRGDIDGGFGGLLRAALRPRLHPLPVGKRRRHSLPRPVEPGIPPRRQEGQSELYDRRLLLLRRRQDRQLRLRNPGGRQAGRLRLPAPEVQVLGPVRQWRLVPDRSMECRRRRPLFQ